MVENRFTEEWLAQRLQFRQTPPAASQTPSKAIPRKYRNQPTSVDGLLFDSKKESQRYQQLHLLERVGAIKDLVLQPMYDLIACNGEIVGRFTPDFQYFSLELGRLVVEDIKSPITKRETAYNLRKRLFEACHGIMLTEL